jgi:hypothetical protein
MGLVEDGNSGAKKGEFISRFSGAKSVGLLDGLLGFFPGIIKLIWLVVWNMNFE